MSGISSILSVINRSSKELPYRPYIIPLDVHNHDQALVDEKRYFQYWPDDLRVNKQINWDTKNIPGLSHPIYQWISGGSREITFTARFTRDRMLTPDEANAFRSAYSTGGNSELESGKKTISDPNNVDIPSAISWLEAFLYPEVSVGNLDLPKNVTGRPFPPRKMLLGFPNMRLGRSKRYGNEFVACIMLACDVSYQGHFSDGSPRMVTAALHFAEITQLAGQVDIHDAFALRVPGIAGYLQRMGPGDK